MKTIRLTQDKYAIVDEADYELVSKYKWFASKEANNWYAKRGIYNKITQLSQENIFPLRTVLDNIINCNIIHCYGSRYKSTYR